MQGFVHSAVTRFGRCGINSKHKHLISQSHGSKSTHSVMVQRDDLPRVKLSIRTRRKAGQTLNLVNMVVEFLKLLLAHWDFHHFKTISQVTDNIGNNIRVVWRKNALLVSGVRVVRDHRKATGSQVAAGYS